MKKSLYLKIMLLISVVSLCLLIAISYELGLWNRINISQFVELAAKVFQNNYIASILCSIISVIIIYIIQLQYSKHMIKKDFRCDEAIRDIFLGIQCMPKILKDFEACGDFREISDFSERNRIKAEVYYKYLLNNYNEIELASLSMSYEGNNVLLDSVCSCFLINLNFKLLKIVNNIKNRLPNIRSGFPTITAYFENSPLEGTEVDIRVFNGTMDSYITDLKFMAAYWKELLIYLKVDLDLLEAQNTLINTDDDLQDKLCKYMRGDLPFKEKVKFMITVLWKGFKAQH